MPIARRFLGRGARHDRAGLVVAFVACSVCLFVPATRADELGAVEGRVLTFGARSPIEGARVSVDGDSASGAEPTPRVRFTSAASAPGPASC